MNAVIKLHLRNYLRHFSGLPAACWQGIVLTLLEATAGGISFFLSVYFTQFLQMEVETAGLLISCYGGGRVVGGLLGGRLSDSMSPKIITIGSLLIQGCTYSSLIVVRAPWLLAVILFFQGIGVYSFQASNNLVVINECRGDREKKLKAINILYNAANVGLGVSAIIVAIFSSYGFRYLFLSTAALFFMCAAGLAWQTFKRGAGPRVAPEAPAEETAVADIPARQSVLWLSLACLLIVGMMTAQLGTTYPTYVTAHFPDMGVGGIGFLFTMNSLLVVLFQTPLVNKFSKSNSIHMMGIGAFFFALGMFMLVIPLGFVWAVASCVVYTLGEMVFSAMAQLVCYDHAAADKKGRGLGLYQATNGFGLVVGPAVGAWVYQHAGDGALWYTCGGLGLFCLIACSYYKRYDCNTALAAERS